MQISFVAPGLVRSGSWVVAQAEGAALAGAAAAADKASGGALGRAAKYARFTGKSGQMVELSAPAGLAAHRLLLVEQSGSDGRQLSVLGFTRYTIDLDQFASPARNTLRKTDELFLSELLWPATPDLNPRIRNAYFSEANNRISAPLYCLAFAMIAMAAILRGRRQRGPIAMRLTLAALAAIALRIAGYGVQGLAQNRPALCVFFYVIPLAGLFIAWLVLMGFSPAAILARRRRRHAQATLS